jgi:hypothetical protein
MGAQAWAARPHIQPWVLHILRLLLCLDDVILSVLFSRQCQPRRRWRRTRSRGIVQKYTQEPVLTHPPRSPQPPTIMSSSAQTMRAVLVRDGKGDAGALFLGDAPRPAPGPTKVLVKIRAFGLNRMDIMQRNGAYPGACSPCGCGRAEALTACSAERRERDPRRRVRGDRRARRAAAGGGRLRRRGEGSARGDRALEGGRQGLRARVRCACLPSTPLDGADRLSYPHGAYTEYIVSPAKHLIPKPASLSFFDAASIPEVWLTGACRPPGRLRCLTHTCSVTGAAC